MGPGKNQKPLSSCRLASLRDSAFPISGRLPRTRPPDPVALYPLSPFLYHYSVVSCLVGMKPCSEAAAPTPTSTIPRSQLYGGEGGAQ